MSRRLVFSTIVLLLAVVVVLVFFEVAVRVLNPQSMMYPRYRHSMRFGHLLPESSTIIEEKPGLWRFVYHTNEYGYRSPLPAISNCYDQPNVVVLGDSNTFGFGVNDGEEYPAVLAAEFAGRVGIVNLGMGSFGLTHQIRTFYEFGVLFQPAVVLLQFAENDPDDNVYEMVTVLAGNRFRFVRDRSMESELADVKSWLSQSVLQRSAAYNFVRNYAYAFWRGRVDRNESAADHDRKEELYNGLLTAFAEDLHYRGIPLVFFDVPGHLGKWPGIHSAAENLDRRGIMRFLLTSQWFDGVIDYGTPEGHPWGEKGHRVAARRLAADLRTALSELPQVTTRRCADRRSLPVAAAVPPAAPPGQPLPDVPEAAGGASR